MVEAGALQGATAVHGLHVWPRLQSGVFASRVRPAVASGLGGPRDLFMLGAWIGTESKAVDGCDQTFKYRSFDKQVQAHAVQTTEHNLLDQLPLLMQAGTIMAASTMFRALVRGRGGHGGMPHLATDPVIAAAAIVQALQPLVSRETDPVDSAVISVTRLSTGAAADLVCHGRACVHIRRTVQVAGHIF